MNDDPLKRLQDTGPIDQQHLWPIRVPRERVERFVGGSIMRVRVLGGFEEPVPETLTEETVWNGKRFEVQARFIPASTDDPEIPDPHASAHSVEMHVLKGRIPRRGDTILIEVDTMPGFGAETSGLAGGPEDDPSSN